MGNNAKEGEIKQDAAASHRVTEINRTNFPCKIFLQLAYHIPRSQL